jgi:hypothetical protein
MVDKPGWNLLLRPVDVADLHPAHSDHRIISCSADTVRDRLV